MAATVKDTVTSDKHDGVRAPEGIVRAAVAGGESAASNQRAISAAATDRTTADRAAVAGGILPPKPDFFDSNSQDTKAPTLKSTDRAFDNLPPNEINYGKDGKTRRQTVDADGTVSRWTDDLKSGSERNEVIHPDKSAELTTSSKGVLETKKFDKDGNLRDDELNLSRTKDGKLNYTGEKSWNASGKLQQDNNRWQDKDGTWHEDNTMNLPDGTRIHNTMDGYRSERKTTNPDGSWSDEVKTMNVDKINPDTGKHYKTMTIDRTES